MLIAFYIVAFLAVASAINVLFLRSPVYCALSMVATFFFLGVLYILLNQEFVAASCRKCSTSWRGRRPPGPKARN